MDKKETAEYIRDFFTGMKKGNPANLEIIAESENWQELAEMELKR